MATKKKETPTDVEIVALRKAKVIVPIIGESPLILNSMSAKAKRDLLLGSTRKTAAEKQASIKHDPYSEYRNSIYKLPEGNPTLIGLPAPAFKGAMATATLETVGAGTKAGANRQLFVSKSLVPIYGVPMLRMDIVRSADMKKTPDVRTRACIQDWAAYIEIEYIDTVFTPTKITTLIANAGLVIGVGDFRQEKGKGDNGRFRVVRDNDPLFQAIIANGGREAQINAMSDPLPYDEQAAELLPLYDEAMARRQAGLPVDDEEEVLVPDEEETEQ